MRCVVNPFRRRSGKRVLVNWASPVFNSTKLIARLYYFTHPFQRVSISLTVLWCFRSPSAVVIKQSENFEGFFSGRSRGQAVFDGFRWFELNAELRRFLLVYVISGVSVLSLGIYGSSGRLVLYDSEVTCTVKWKETWVHLSRWGICNLVLEWLIRLQQCLSSCSVISFEAVLGKSI